MESLERNIGFSTLGFATENKSMPQGQKFLIFLFKGIAKIDIALALLIAISELIFTAVPDAYTYVYNTYNIKGDTISRGQLPHETWLFTTVLIFATFWLILESWLYKTLYKGALEFDSKLLNQWINVRVIFLALSILQTLYRIIELEFCLYDTVYIPILMYRILEIIFVKGLTVEILRAQYDLNV